SNMIWDRCVNIIENNDFAGCKDQFLEIMAMEVPFTEDDLLTKRREDVCEMAFEAAMANFKRRTDKMAETAYPVVKNICENQEGMYENIAIPVTDGRRVYQIIASLNEANETQCRSIVKEVEKRIILMTIDEVWKENLRELDELKHSVQNASYEQKDPLLIFKLESVKLFDAMIDKLNNQVVAILMRAQIPVVVQSAPAPAPEMPEEPRPQYTESRSDDYESAQQAAAHQDTREQRSEPVTVDKAPGRNDPCPCGSGKKFKNCHGKGL
ncbi:MAG: SEC-C domain-containing protein, partial [Bacteroidaceae bacterium]|nr:SEC-C domain-containing protein [Bacteroidaceae bacterium]